MDEVFKAIGDPSRRALLDALFAEDGQTLTALCGHLPEMTRQGVMNHLSVLEEAGLITTRRDGRDKHHYLNPVPIRLIHDRWIDKYTEMKAAAIVAIKAGVEGGSRMKRPSHVYVAHIRAPATEVWRALTDVEMTVQYYYGGRVESTWRPGDSVTYTFPDGTLVADGEVLAVEEGKRLEMTFHARWDPEIEAEGPVREAWTLEESDGLTKLTHEMWDLDPESKSFREFTSGDAFIISGLKTLLETGIPMSEAV